MKMNEKSIQAQAVSWFRNTYCLKTCNPRGVIFSVPNELAGNNAIATMQAKAMGLMAGVSDTILILPNGKLIFCEFKDAKGVQSERQKDFESVVTSHGYEYWLIRDFETFKSKVLNLC